MSPATKIVMTTYWKWIEEGSFMLAYLFSFKNRWFLTNCLLVLLQRLPQGIKGDCNRSKGTKQQPNRELLARLLLKPPAQSSPSSNDCKELERQTHVFDPSGHLWPFRIGIGLIWDHFSKLMDSKWKNSSIQKNNTCPPSFSKCGKSPNLVTWFVAAKHAQTSKVYFCLGDIFFGSLLFPAGHLYQSRFP